MNRACQLIEELGAGEVVGGVVDVYTNVKEGRRIPFEPEKYNHLLGTRIPAETMLSYFTKLELGYDKEKNEVVIPSSIHDTAIKPISPMSVIIKKRIVFIYAKNVREAVFISDEDIKARAAWSRHPN